MKNFEINVSSMYITDLIQEIYRFEINNDQESYSVNRKAQFQMVNELCNRIDITSEAARLFSVIAYQYIWFGLQLRSNILSTFKDSNQSGEYLKAIMELEERGLVKSFRSSRDYKVYIELPKKVEKRLLGNQSLSNRDSNDEVIKVLLTELSDTDYLILFEDRIIGCAFGDESKVEYEIYLEGEFYCYSKDLEFSRIEIQNMIEKGDLIV